MTETTNNGEAKIELEPPNFPKATTVFLGGIFFLMLLAALQVSGDVIIPLVLAFMLKLIFLPTQRFLERLRLRPVFAALIVVGLLIGGTAGLGYILSEPASTWTAKLSRSIPVLEKRMRFISDPIEKAQKITEKAETLTQKDNKKVLEVSVQGNRLYDKIFVSTKAFLSGVFTTILLLFFMLASGDTVLRRLVEVLPSFKNKRQAVNISTQIEKDISMYLLTITAMNFVVAILTGIVMLSFGLENAILWATLAFFLNYIPIIGPIFGFIIFIVVGLLSNADILIAVMPALLYLFIHLAESNLVTPMLLAKRFILNPLIVIVSLIFWYWLWGVPGALLAMPMLATLKIVFSHITRLKPLGHFLEG